MSEIIQARNSGFCFGVRRAIEKTEDTIQKNKDNLRNIYTCGPLIHNKGVTDDLAQKGVKIIESPEEASFGDLLIVRSHGEGETFYERAEERGLEIVDATCPFVMKIQKLVKQAKAEGYNIVVVGDKDHPEVKGINGWCGFSSIIINSEEEAENIEVDNLFIVAQTTIKYELLESIIKILKKSGKKFHIENTICNATSDRQESCMQTAKECDAMIIVGGKDSSNTRKLYEIAKKYCKKTYFIEKIQELPLKDLKKCNKIGIAAGASTPERIIKEVIASMSEFITENQEDNLMHALMEEIEKSLRLPRTGEIVTGEVIQVSDREVVVNLGCKKDGIITKDELTLEGDQKLTDLFKEGDIIQAKVLKTDSGDGNILLSKKKLEVNEHWDEINAALEDRSFVNAKVVKEVNGGVIASYKEVFGFIPLSQLSDRFVESASEFVGKVLPVRVTRVDQRKGKAVFSHKAFLVEEKQAKVAEIWEGLNVGDIVAGTVMRFTDYGAFVDIGGLDGLLHISEISWGKLKHPQEVLSIGEKVQVKILAMNTEKGKISLGLKQNQPEPWTIIDDKYQVGQVISGKIVQIKDYGAFVELEPGLDGLVHISEIAHKRVTNIADEISVGQDVDAKILEIDKEKKRISLSIKETLEPPIYAEEVTEEIEFTDDYEAVEEVEIEAEVEVEAEAEAIAVEKEVEAEAEVEAEVEATEEIKE
ncbi:MAG TPA: bifunctional 4-hydroxy-3-methylbut-2-enyl diphosphate reductase/30S ribosomal protein S1 [Anaerovoracaceae bacterium]|nr:bifunctional 4-hydroxy-3-methylbut-2-enyl diphosphate reductase/30S ribosomal protein S1 [Anaerovoracaceae bacterium]